MRLRDFCFVWTAASVLIVSASFAQAAGKSALVCNNTGKRVKVAIGWMDYGFPVASGWVSIANDTCNRLVASKADTYLPLFGYAIDTAGVEYRPNTEVKNNFCINRADNFADKSTTFCAAKDGYFKEVVSDWESFRALGNPIAESYRWNIE